MKKRTKLVGLILLAALLTATFSGCSYEEEYVPVDTQTDVLQNTENSNGTVSIPNLTQILPVNGEDFSLICKYDTGKYSLKKLACNGYKVDQHECAYQKFAGWV